MFGPGNHRMIIERMRRMRRGAGNGRCEEDEDLD